MLNPQVQIPADATKIHGITNEMVKNCPTFKDVAPKLLKIIEEANALIGYNIRNYDSNVLYIEFLRAGYDLKMPPLLDIYEMVKDLEQSKKLKDVYIRCFNEVMEKQHDAMGDIEATKKIHEYLYNKYYKIG